MMNLANFKDFLGDETAWEMFISGQAGTGKTTMLHDLVEYCMIEDIPYVVCAFTHKACGILRDKLPEGAIVETLHKFLKKRPGVNDRATKREHVTVSAKTGDSERKRIMFLDEYSMVGEKDYTDIGSEQDPEASGKPDMKVLYLGDPNQLPPVGDVPSVYPSGKYNYTLTKIYRQADNNPLLDTLTQLVTFINGAKPVPLIESSHFLRGQAIVPHYKYNDEDDKVILAFTNKRVQELNFEIAGTVNPYEQAHVYSPTMRHHYKYYMSYDATEITYIDRVFDDQLHFNSKYRTLEHLIKMDCCEFMHVVDEDDYEYVFATIFGHYNYKKSMEALQEAAVQANKDIESQTTVKAKVWAAANPTKPLARARSKAWRDYITFKDCVVCMDFPYAMTVHKSQGSTYDTVYVDTKDLGICADSNYSMYLKLLYVAISRASNKVYTN